MNKNTILVLVLAMTLGACAATGPRYTEQVRSEASIPSQSARLTVFRTAESMQYSGRAATVSIDGKEVGTCKYAGFNTFDVPAGSHVLVVNMWDAPGTCQLKIEVLGGSTYFYEIVPRAANVAAALPGAFVSGFGIIGAIVGLTYSFAAMSAESTGKECGGAFAVVGVEEAFALSKLDTLRKSQ